MPRMFLFFFYFIFPILSFSQIQKNLSDEQLMDLVQKQTFRYFWDFAHPVSGLARERSNTDFGYGHETCTIGGTGFGVMAIIAGVERKWISREEGAARIMSKKATNSGENMASKMPLMKVKTGMPPLIWPLTRGRS